MTTTTHSPQERIVARLRTSRLQVPDPDIELGPLAGRRWAEEEAEWWQLTRLTQRFGDWDEDTWAAWREDRFLPLDTGGPPPEPLFAHVPLILGVVDGCSPDDSSSTIESWWLARNAPPGVGSAWIIGWVEGTLDVYRDVAGAVLAE